MTRIHELLGARGCVLSYQSLRRFVLKRNWRKRSKTTVRMEDPPPGEVAEADFGRLGMITDPATGRRKAVWAMVIVLCHSRHCFLWPMQRQQLEDVIAGLETAWAFLRRMPQYLVIDNFPAAVVGTDPLHPILTRGFLEYSQHRGFISRRRSRQAPQGQAQGGEECALRQGALLQGRRFQRSGPSAGGRAAVVSGRGRNAHSRHHPQEAPGGFQDEERTP